MKGISGVDRSKNAILLFTHLNQFYKSSPTIMTVSTQLAPSISNNAMVRCYRAQRNYSSTKQKVTLGLNLSSNVLDYPTTSNSKNPKSSTRSPQKPKSSTFSISIHYNLERKSTSPRSGVGPPVGREENKRRRERLYG